MHRDGHNSVFINYSNSNYNDGKINRISWTTEINIVTMRSEQKKQNVWLIRLKALCTLYNIRWETVVNTFTVFSVYIRRSRYFIQCERCSLV